MKPTEVAEMSFQIAYVHAVEATGVFHTSNQAGFTNLAMSLKELSIGLKHLTVGVRATYILLAQVQAQLAQPKTPGRP